MWDVLAKRKTMRLMLGGTVRCKKQYQPFLQAQQLKELNKLCRETLDALSMCEDAWIFEAAVDPVLLNIPTYFHIIKHPICLLDVRENVEENQYHSIVTFAKDLDRCFSNCLTFNPPRSDVSVAAKAM